MTTKVKLPHPTYSPACICEHTYDESGRFPVWRIPVMNPECLQHGWRTRVDIASILRYGD